MYFNYKGRNSLVLLGLADAAYKFIYVNVGVNGRISDGGVFQRSNLSKAMKTNSLNFPAATNLSERELKVPYVIIADDAFPLLPNLMKPYSLRGLDHDSKIFNYRLLVRRIIESSFGILANRFRVLLNPIGLSPAKVENIIMICVVLHNFLCCTKSSTYTDIPNIAEQNLEALKQIQRQSGNGSADLARKVRDEYRSYFNSPAGMVEWQENSIQTHNL